MKNISTNKQSGAVSLFIVIFAMLLITVVTISFLRLMINDQQQASNTDLSQSAYDSAQAGVEDAKRALINYQRDCSISPAACDTYAGRIVTNTCNTGLKSVTGPTMTDAEAQKEVLVQQSSTGNDKDLQQAYTCVKMTLETDDYEGDLEANESELVPLFSKYAFDRVGIEWFSDKDLSTGSASKIIDAEPISATGQPLYTKAEWPINRPSLMRAQLIQFSHTFNLDSFNGVSGSRSNTGTMFLYPTRQQNIGAKSLVGTDFRSTGPTDEPDPKSALSTPTPISCFPNLNSGGFACSSVIILPLAIGASGATPEGDRIAFLRLMPLYNAAHYRVTLWNGPVDINNPAITPQKFKDVQPEIDSTGRANDVYRRVVSRVNLYDSSFDYPEATIDVNGNFCKDFAVTNDTYIPGSAGCTP